MFRLLENSTIFATDFKNFLPKRGQNISSFGRVEKFQFFKFIGLTDGSLLHILNIKIVIELQAMMEAMSGIVPG
jgi:hypothetical protein